MDKQLLDILVCPVSGASVTLADAALLERLNQRIDAGNALYVDGGPVTESVQALLVTRDKHTGYQIKDGIPVMLPEMGIAMPDTDTRPA